LTEHEVRVSNIKESKGCPFPWHQFLLNSIKDRQLFTAAGQKFTLKRIPAIK
jgi:hypothetical protein